MGVKHLFWGFLGITLFLGGNVHAKTAESVLEELMRAFKGRTWVDVCEETFDEKESFYEEPSILTVPVEYLDDPTVKLPYKRKKVSDPPEETTINPPEETLEETTKEPPEETTEEPTEEPTEETTEEPTEETTEEPTEETTEEPTEETTEEPTEETTEEPTEETTEGPTEGCTLTECPEDKPLLNEDSCMCVACLSDTDCGDCERCEQNSCTSTLENNQVCCNKTPQSGDSCCGTTGYYQAEKDCCGETLYDICDSSKGLSRDTSTCTCVCAPGQGLWEDSCTECNAEHVTCTTPKRSIPTLSDGVCTCDCPNNVYWQKDSKGNCACTACAVDENGRPYCPGSEP